MTLANRIAERIEQRTQKTRRRIAARRIRFVLKHGHALPKTLTQRKSYSFWAAIAARHAGLDGVYKWHRMSHFRQKPQREWVVAMNDRARH